MNDNTASAETPRPRGGCRLFAIVFGAVLAALLVAAVILKLWLFPSELEPVQLKAGEKITLNHKLKALGYAREAFAVGTADEEALEPLPYSEEGASREIDFSERELNGLLAKNTDLARKLAIDLADDLASARLVLPLDPDLPILGGQTLRMSAGLEARFEHGRPVIILKGVSAWGIPLPNAWLGNLKDVDLIAQYGTQGGFWQSFADGVDDIAVQDGKLYIRLKP